MVGTTLADWKHYLISLAQNWEVSVLVAFVISTLCAWTGLSRELVIIFLILMITDLLLGLYVAVVSNQFKCYKLRRGVMKLIIWTLCIILAHVLDITLSAVMKVEIDLFCLFSVAYVVFTDISSITKHLLRLNLPVPEIFILLTDSAKRKLHRKINEFIGEDRRKSDRRKEVEKVEDDEK